MLKYSSLDTSWKLIQVEARHSWTEHGNPYLTGLLRNRTKVEPKLLPSKQKKWQTYLFETSKSEVGVCDQEHLLETSNIEPGVWDRREFDFPPMRPGRGEKRIYYCSPDIHI